MRRVLTLLLCLSFAALPVRGAGEKYVALTFDDGPSGAITEQLLDGLYDRGVKATFLLCGYRIRVYPQVTQRIFREGHEIGLHGYSHSLMHTMSRRDIARELMDTQALLPQGCSPVLFRPPGGRCSDAVHQVAEARKLAILGWSVDPRDWAGGDQAAIEAAVLEGIRDGDIVLLHDMSRRSVAAALAIVDKLLTEGYRFVTVSELARLRGEKLQPGQIYHCFPEEAGFVGDNSKAVDKP